ncbi:MAG: class I SAM-dependent methyltransferase [Anaerolineae bacterium]|nr:class I SAM-dependent methyltransferase [Anaerolineae bacterium]
MQDFYTRFYAATRHSPAHSAFCEQVFGRDLCQHGFVDMAQLDALLACLRLKPGGWVLDVGCGSGMIAEYISDCTGAHMTGIDYMVEAIDQARERTAHKANRMQFMTGDINALDLPPAAFDAIIALDSLYFSHDYAYTLRQFVQAARPGGQMAIFYSYGREPWVPTGQFPADTLLPDRTPLGAALTTLRLPFTTQDFTEADYQLAVKREQVLRELYPQFAAEDIMFIYENRLGDAQGVQQAVQAGLHARYLYHVSVPL